MGCRVEDIYPTGSSIPQAGHGPDLEEEKEHKSAWMRGSVLEMKVWLSHWPWLIGT